MSCRKYEAQAYNKVFSIYCASLIRRRFRLDFLPLRRSVTDTHISFELKKHLRSHGRQ